MDKEKKAFVEGEDVKEINRSAEKAYMFKTNNDSRYRTEYNRLAALVVGRIAREKITNICRDDYQEYAAYTFIGCFKDWKPGKADFWAYYKSIVNRRKNDIYTENLDTLERGAYRKMKKNKSDTADINREDIFYSSEDDSSVKEIAGTDDTEKAVLEDDIMKRQGDIMKQHFDVLNNAVIAQKMKYKNSPKPCYPAYFYTEFVTHCIDKESDRSVFDKSENDLMKVIEHDFVSYYMHGDNSSVAGIAQGRLKMLSEITGKAEDDRPCGYDLENIVYATYISNYVKEEDTVQSEQSISPHRTKFFRLIRLEMRKSFDNE